MEALSLPQSLPPLLWMAPVLSGGGYSSEAIGFALGIAADKEHRIALRQFAEQADQDFVYGLDPEVRDTLSVLLERGSQPKANRGVVVCHATPDAWLPSKFPGWDALAPCPPPGAAYAVGRTMYETDSVPADWVARCEQMDEVWVPTEFHRETFAAAGVPMHKLVVVGEPVDTAFFDPAAHAPLPMPAAGGGPWALEHVAGEPMLYDVRDGLLAASVSAAGAVGEAAGAAGSGAGGAGGGERPFRFLSVFKWEQRKGWDVLLAAFLLEFEAEAAAEAAEEAAAEAAAAGGGGGGEAAEAAAGSTEGGTARPRVELLLKTRPFHSEGNFGELVRSFAAERGLPSAALRRVRILDEELALRALPRLYAAADAFVLPSRGEGWGRPHVEAMAMGLPVIATNWSGPTAFLSEETGYPLDYELAPLPDELHQPGHRWAEPSLEHLRRLMRRVVEQPAEARRRGAAARAHMVARFSPASLAKDVARQLERIGGSAVWASREELWGPHRKGKKKKRGSFAHYSDTVNVPH